MRSIGEAAHDPFIYSPNSGDPGIDAVNTAIAVGIAATTAPPEPPAPLCTPGDAGEQTDPPHTCPSTAGAARPPADSR